MARRRPASSSPAAPAALALLLLLAVASTAAAADAPATTKTAATIAHSKGGKGKCAATFAGCLACSTVGGAYTCTKCRANATFDDASQTCVCDAPDYGIVPLKVYEAYVAQFCKGKKHCKVPKYSAIKDKCVKCADYLGAQPVDGYCIDPIVTVRDTKLTISNGMTSSQPDCDKNPACLTVNLGQCTLGCNADPNYLIPRVLAPGESTSQQGWNPFASADLTADLTFCTEWSFLTGLCTKRDIVRVESGNPSIGKPWVTIGGQKHKFDEGETWTTTSNGHAFSVTRGGDLDAAKDMVVTVLS